VRNRKKNYELIREGGRDYLSAIKDTTELREKIRQITKDSMVELFSYESGERVFGIRKKCGEVYEFIYFDERRAKRERRRRGRGR
jgi:hypothetical protein